MNIEAKKEKSYMDNSLFPNPKRGEAFPQETSYLLASFTIIITWFQAKVKLCQLPWIEYPCLAQRVV